MEVVLRGGRVIDPVPQFDGVADVVVRDGVIVAVGPDAGLAASTDASVIDCSGLIVTPGLIDLHCHVFAGLGNFCVTADQAASSEAFRSWSTGVRAGRRRSTSLAPQ